MSIGKYIVGEVCRNLAERRDLALTNGEPPERFLSRNGPFVPELTLMRKTFLDRYGRAGIQEEIFHSQSSNIVVAYLSLHDDSDKCAEGIVIDRGADKLYACRWSDAQYTHPTINCLASADGVMSDSFDLTEQEFTNYVNLWLPKKEKAAK